MTRSTPEWVATHDDQRAVGFENRLCAADGCDRLAEVSTPLGRACNMHYLRVRTYNSFDLPPRRKRQTQFDCAWCGSPFTRTYAITIRRQNGRQFCSIACEAAAKRQRSDENLSARFWSHVDQRGPQECWPWTGRTGWFGYGYFDYQDRPHIASRMAYRLSKGDPGNLQVCHSCDNPPCCNPSHLWLGTAKDNVDDMLAKGRGRRGRPRLGQEHHMARLTEDSVRYIRQSDESNTTLGRRYGISATAIGYVRSRRTWRHVP